MRPRDPRPPPPAKASPSYALYFGGTSYYYDDRLAEAARKRPMNRLDLPPSTCSRGRGLARGEPTGGVATTPPVALQGWLRAGRRTGAEHLVLLQRRRPGRSPRSYSW